LNHSWLHQITMNEAFTLLSTYQSSLLQQITHRGLRYLIVGGFAIRYYGYIRPTVDLDLFVERTSENINVLVSVLSQLGAVNLDKVGDHLLRLDTKVTWRDVDIFTTMKGLQFGDLFYDCTVANFRGIQFPIISKNHLIDTKRLALNDPDRFGYRDIDQEDLEFLEKGPLHGSKHNTEQHKGNF